MTHGLSLGVREEGVCGGRPRAPARDGDGQGEHGAGEGEAHGGDDSAASGPTEEFVRGLVRSGRRAAGAGLDSRRKQGAGHGNDRPASPRRSHSGGRAPPQGPMAQPAPTRGAGQRAQKDVLE